MQNIEREPQTGETGETGPRPAEFPGEPNKTKEQLEAQEAQKSVGQQGENIAEGKRQFESGRPATRAEIRTAERGNIEREGINLDAKKIALTDQMLKDGRKWPEIQTALEKLEEQEKVGPAGNALEEEGNHQN